MGYHWCGLSGKGHSRDSKVRVIRDGVVIYDDALASLSIIKMMSKVANGREGGLMIEGYNQDGYHRKHVLLERSKK